VKCIEVAWFNIQDTPISLRSLHQLASLMECGSFLE
jgi:hypothetical protein